VIGPFSELVVEDYDDEQVWQQLELRNKPLLRFVEMRLRKYAVKARQSDLMLPTIKVTKNDQKVDGGNDEGVEREDLIAEDGRNDDDDMKAPEMEMEVFHKVNLGAKDDDEGCGDNDDHGITLRSCRERNGSRHGRLGSDALQACDLWGLHGVPTAGETGAEHYHRTMEKFVDEAEMGKGDEDMDALYADDDEDGSVEDEGEGAVADEAEEMVEEHSGADSYEGQGLVARCVNTEEAEGSEDKMLPTEFRSSQTFEGAREGYVFRSGLLGVGYYLDSVSQRAGRAIVNGSQHARPSTAMMSERYRAHGDTTAWPHDNEGHLGDGSEQLGDAPLSTSSHARALGRQAQRLSKLEQAQLAEKPWQMSGEVSGMRRPIDSLLEADLDFSQATRLVPTIAEEVTTSVDDMLRVRIKEQLWDDVIRLAALEPRSFRAKPADLSTDRSAIGLGDQYAADYEQEMLGHASAESVSTDDVHRAVRQLFSKLSTRLDVMFSLYAVPKPHQIEATVRARFSTIHLEEATPTAMPAADAMAPEEIYRQQQGLKQLANHGELSQEERSSLRRKKKRVRRRLSAEVEAREALRATLDSTGAAGRRRDARKAQEQLVEAKQKSTVLTGQATLSSCFSSAASSGIERKPSSGRQFTNSAHYFASFHGMLAASDTVDRGMKRQRESAGNDVPNRCRPAVSHKYKL